jgi:hypothetical protein
VPLAALALTAAGTIVAILNHQTGENLTLPLVIAWSIAAGTILLTVVGSLRTIRQLPRPTGETPSLASDTERRVTKPSTEFQAKHLEV